MKRVYLAIFAILTLSSIGYAQNNKEVIPPSVPPIVVDIWSGFYVGISAGYLKGKDDFAGKHTKKIELIDLGRGGFKTSNINPSGFMGGVFAGYNKLISNNYVLGAEGIFNFTKVNDSNNIKTIQGEVTNTIFDLEQKNEAALYLKAGKVIDNKYMPYILIGGSWTNLYGSLKSSTQHFRDKAKDIGFTGGTGVEINLSKNWNMRLQYRFTDYGDVKFNYKISNVPVNVKIKYKTHTFKAGVSYKFD